MLFDGIPRWRHPVSLDTRQSSSSGVAPAPGSVPPQLVTDCKGYGTVSAMRIPRHACQGTGLVLVSAFTWAGGGGICSARQARANAGNKPTRKKLRKPRDPKQIDTGGDLRSDGDTAIWWLESSRDESVSE